jgi:hypothetical protein
LVCPEGAHGLKDYTAGKSWKIEKQQHILETAYELFLEKGIIPVTITDIAEANLYGCIAVFFFCLDLSNDAGACLKNSNRDQHSVLIEDLGHSDLCS